MFQYMNYVYEVSKTGSFSKAAKSLYMTQPALSIAIKKEEAELGQPLFDRTSSPISLTDAGRAYMESVEKIRNIESSLRLYCNDLSGLKTGRVRVGASNFFLSQVVLSVISRFSARYPGIEIDVQEATSLELKERILREELDLIIDPLSFDEGFFTNHHLFYENFILAVPMSMEINGRITPYALSRDHIRRNVHLTDSCPGVPLELFSEEPFILLKPETVTYGRAIEICHNYGFTPKVRFCLDQLTTSYRFAGKGLGIAFVTDALIKLTPFEESVLFYKIDSPLAKREIAAVHKRNRYMSSAVLEFLEIAKDVLSDNENFT